jgi:hypothetical protein
MCVRPGRVWARRVSEAACPGRGRAGGACESGSAGPGEVPAPIFFMSALAYDWLVTTPQRTLFKTGLVLIAFAFAVAGLAMGLHRLIR